jgi:hypothetical protein
MPVKDPHTRIKPLTLASGHGRYITVTPERTPVSVGEWPLHISHPDSRWTTGARRIWGGELGCCNTAVVPVKYSHTRIKPLALASGHGRYITVTPERTLLSVGEWPLHIDIAISLPKRFRNGRFTSETATWIQVQYFKKIRWDF